MAVNTSPNTGLGTTLSYSSLVGANIHSANFSGWERAVVNTTHFGTTGGKSFMPGELYDPGELTVEFEWPVGPTYPASMMADAPTTSIVVTFATGNTMTGTGFCKSLTIQDSSSPDELMMATAVLKFTGTLTYANA